MEEDDKFDLYQALNVNDRLVAQNERLVAHNVRLNGIIRRLEERPDFQGVMEGALPTDRPPEVQERARTKRPLSPGEQAKKTAHYIEQIHILERKVATRKRVISELEAVRRWESGTTQKLYEALVMIVCIDPEWEEGELPAQIATAAINVYEKRMGPRPKEEA